MCKIGSPLLSFLLCSLCTPLQYSNEINNISTFEVMRDNLNSINKSRINVDVDKILQQHQDQWQETYQKYLKLSRSSHKFIGIDFSEHEASIQFAKLAENLNIQIKNSPQISQETLVLRSILEQILEECLFSTQYGLETYLSSRIRHGYTLLLNGKYFVSFVDILCILLNNSLTHSGFNQMANLEIDITATQVTEQEKSELIDIIPAFHSGHQHIMRLQVKNRAAAS